MNLVESVKICHKDAVPMDIDGLFLYRDETVKFCYREGNSMVALSMEGEREIWYTAPDGEPLPDPSCWTNASPGFEPVLDRRMGIDKTTEVYYFDDHTIAHKGPWDYVCRRDGEQVWTFEGQAWRYTDIEKYGSNIYFGTAGQGGYFYLLNLHTGKPLLELKTGGTAHIYARRDNKLYLLRQEDQAQLVCVDLNDGTILECLTLPGVVNEVCGIKLIGNTVHAVTLFYEHGLNFSHACWHQIEI